MLNPDHGNLGIALSVVDILKYILGNRKDIEFLAEKAIPLLKDVIGMALSAFGVIYTWLSLALGNPGAQIGAGVGGFVGGVTSFCLMFSVNSERIHSHRKLFTVTRIKSDVSTPCESAVAPKSLQSRTVLSLVRHKSGVWTIRYIVNLHRGMQTTRLAACVGCLCLTRQTF